MLQIAEVLVLLFEKQPGNVLLFANQGSLRWVQGNAEQLPFEDGSFDSYTVACGIRNVTDRDAALREAFR